MGKFTLT